MVNGVPVRSRSRRVPARRRRAGASPKPRAVKGATYRFTLSLCGYPINVFQIDELPDGDLAAFYTDDHEIYLTPAPHAAGTLDRLLHEVIHAIDVIALPQADRLAEPAVGALGTFLADALIRNPDFRTLVVDLATLAADQADPVTR